MAFPDPTDESACRDVCIEVAPVAAMLYARLPVVALAPVSVLTTVIVKVPPVAVTVMEET